MTVVTINQLLSNFLHEFTVSVTAPKQLMRDVLARNTWE